ncbi:hypothetical protein U9M48_040913 [Paspalum notatum var. saurae]|uniref:Reverse transcriptase domain-containing protein n=1 Tax=Paspalum notatum var. saurae TaxID=547442 RepID=A0AAQ3XEQ1_PASNO
MPQRTSQQYQVLRVDDQNCRQTLPGVQAVVLCDECGSEDHVTKACSPYKNLKFTAIPSGYAVDGLGFYSIPYVGKAQGDKTSTLAKITVVDGVMSTANVESELKRLVPGAWEWKVEDSGDSFTATFPSREELNRLIEWGPVVAKCVKATLTIEEKGGNYFRFEIPKVWVQFRGLPDDMLVNFNILWAVGSALGVSRKVDLKFTREHKIARIRVGCLDPNLIPEFLSMLIGEHVYDLQFRAEKNMDPENPSPIDMDLDPPREDGNDNSQEGNGDPALPPSDNSMGTDLGDSGSKHFVSSPISKDKTGKPVTSLWSSKRSAAVADQNSLERASKLKAKINLDGSPNEVYGPAQEDQKQRFLTELASLISKETVPMVIGGDFNILRSPHEKNKGQFKNRWPFLFNAVIDAYNLRELDLSGRQFTWANNLSNQTFEKLDRVLMTTEWESKYPRASVQALTREISDHTPLFLNSGDGDSISTHNDFKFELGWLLHDGFFDMVKEVWTSTSSGTTPMDRWQAKIRRLRQHLRGWAKNVRGAYKKEKKFLLDKLDELDKKSKHTHLDQNELNFKHALHEKVSQLLREEEIKWYQRAKVKNLLEGDANTKYFHLVANGKHRKTRIFGLEQEEGNIVGDVEIRKYITDYYKKLFGHPESSDVVLDENWTDDIPQVSQEENELITAPFTSEEVRAAIFQMEHNKAPGPDGFPPEFYQVFWNIIEPDLMALFEDFHRGSLALNRLNFGNITLIPKVGDANRIQQYRPICLLNVSFKIFTKVATNRLVKVAHKIIRPSQTAFLPGRNIMEGAVVLHETLHELHKKKLNGVIFKINFEKAYDKVRWDFLQQTMRMKGFSHTWCDWIRSFVQGGNVAINVNGQNGSFFQTMKGLRQGDPLSPILFNVVEDMLAIIINRAKVAGKVNGVIPHLMNDGLSILQYADDTVIFLDHNLEMARNMKALLCVFEKLFGLKINFYKSEIFCFGQAKECENDCSELFGCRVGTFPFRYLGLPMHYKKLRNSDWKTIEERFEQRLSGWKGKLLSVGGRLSTNVHVIILCDSKGVLKKLEYFRSRFFWQNDQHKKKYHLIRWDQIRQPKEQGDLGIIDLEIQNKCLLSKWLFKLANEEGTWQDLVRNKYLKGKPLGSRTKKPGISHFWAGLMEVKQTFLNLGSFVIGDGTQVRFWEDIWCGNCPLKFSYPSLFNIVRKKEATVAEVIGSSPLNVSFRRGLHGERLLAWQQLVGRVMNIELRGGKDVFRWDLNKSGVFSVSSMYKHLINNGLKVTQEIWQTKIPLKTKIFLWYIKRGVLLTKDNLARRNWLGHKGFPQHRAGYHLQQLIAFLLSCKQYAWT